MAFGKKKVSCTNCGKKITIWVPRGMSPLGVQSISICDSCWKRIQMQEKGKEGACGEDRPDKDD